MYKGHPDSGVHEIVACGIRNLGHFCLWNQGSWALESRIKLKESGIPLKITTTTTTTNFIENWKITNYITFPPANSL